MSRTIGDCPLHQPSRRVVEFIVDRPFDIHSMLVGLRVDTVMRLRACGGSRVTDTLCAKIGRSKHDTVRVQCVATDLTFEHKT